MTIDDAREIYLLEIGGKGKSKSTKNGTINAGNHQFEEITFYNGDEE